MFSNISYLECADCSRTFLALRGQIVREHFFPQAWPGSRLFVNISCLKPTCWCATEVFQFGSPQTKAGTHGYIKRSPGALPATPLVKMSCETGPSSTPPFLRPQWVDNRLTDAFNVPFWANIRSADVDRSESLSEVQSLLSSPSKITLAQSFEGTEAQFVINFLDQVS